METEPLGISHTIQKNNDDYWAELTFKFYFKTADSKEVFKVLDRAEAIVKEEVKNHGI